MSKFCGNCGAPRQEGAGFCGSCGASQQAAASPSPQSNFPPVSQPEPAASAPPPQFQPVTQPAAQVTSAPAPAAKSSSPWVKVAIVAVVIIFVGGALAVAGVIYVAHKVSQKAHEYSREVLGDSAPSTGAVATDKSPGSTASTDKAEAATGDMCRLLSKEDVGRAIGVEIVQAVPSDVGCSYLAKGTMADMTAKHVGAMMANKGADKKTQGMIEQFAGIIGNSAPKEKSDNETADGNAVVFNFSIDPNNARTQMHLNAKVLGGLGPGQQILDGIGDEAFVEADAMMMVRKGDKLIRIMYSSCPCSTDAIKPLAKQLADSQ